MHPLFAQASGLTHDVIGAAIEVHKDKGPGLLESIYECCLTISVSSVSLCSKMSRDQFSKGRS
jgi:GxxExxY protein